MLKERIECLREAGDVLCEVSLGYRDIAGLPMLTNNRSMMGDLPK